MRVAGIRGSEVVSQVCKNSCSKRWCMDSARHRDHTETQWLPASMVEASHARMHGGAQAACSRRTHSAPHGHRPLSAEKLSKRHGWSTRKRASRLSTAAPQDAAALASTELEERDDGKFRDSRDCAVRQQSVASLRRASNGQQLKSTFHRIRTRSLVATSTPARENSRLEAKRVPGRQLRESICVLGGNGQARTSTGHHWDAHGMLADDDDST